MSQLLITLDGIVVKKVQLSKSRSTVGRRPYNDIVIENLAVSGDHAAIQNTGKQMVLEDLGSTNGTYVNGESIRKQVLQYGDLIEIGRYKIQYLESAATGMGGLSRPIDISTTAFAPPTLGGEAIEGPRVRVLSGAAAGKSKSLTKVVTTIGKPGVSVASVIQRRRGCELVHVVGDQVATVNGISAVKGPIALKHHDRINVGGVQLEFLDR